MSSPPLLLETHKDNRLVFSVKDFGGPEKLRERGTSAVNLQEQATFWFGKNLTRGLDIQGASALRSAKAKELLRLIAPFMMTATADFKKDKPVTEVSGISVKEADGKTAKRRADCLCGFPGGAACAERTKILPPRPW